MSAERVAPLPGYELTPEDCAIFARAGLASAVAWVVGDLRDARVMELIEARREHAWRVHGVALLPRELLCTNPWHAGESFGAHVLPGCPSCGSVLQI